MILIISKIYNRCNLFYKTPCTNVIVVYYDKSVCKSMELRKMIHGGQMKRSLKERVLDYFIYMGRKSRLLKIPAIIGLAVSIWFFRAVEYFKGGTKRFTCVMFILLCFMAGNSFAYPVFQKDSGFVDGEKGQVEAVSEDDSISFADQDEGRDPFVEEEQKEILGSHGTSAEYQYSLSEILDEDKLSEMQLSNENTDSAAEEVKGFSADDWKLILINKQHPLPDDYELTLGNIMTIKGTMKCDERIIEELLVMMRNAENEGVTLAICSPYRDLNYQEGLFNRKIENYMKKGMTYMEAYTLASQAVTVPGASEHQAGLAFDIISNDYVTLDEGFAETKAGQWLSENSCKYGFILRYPKGKEDITGIEFEPWHFRYVGREAAEIINKEGITLEEFWDKYL